jgi:aspartate aminotransferase
VDDIEKYVTAKTVGIVLNSPNNPSGYVLSENEMQKLGTLLKGVGKSWWLISDEIYEYLAFDRPHVSLLNLFPELKDRFFYVNGMSKGFAMTGWRVGYVAGPPPAMKLVRDLQSHSSTCLPPFIEEAATFAIGQGHALLEKELNGLKDRRDLAVEHLKTIPGIDFLQPAGAFYILIDVRRQLAASKNLKPATDFALSEHLLTEHHITVVPGEPFGAPGFLRFSYATSEAAIKEGLTRLKTALSQI